MDFFSVKREPTEKKTEPRVGETLGHYDIVWDFVSNRGSSISMDCSVAGEKVRFFLFKSVGLLFCHLNKKVHNQYNILPMDHQTAPHAKGPFFQDFQELPFNEQTLTLRRTRRLLECGRLRCSWALVLGQRANGLLASWAPLLKLPGEFCFIKFPATWYPSGLIIRSLNGSLLDEKKNVWSQLQRAVGGSGSVLPNSYCALTEVAPITVRCQSLLSP